MYAFKQNGSGTAEFFFLSKMPLRIGGNNCSERAGNAGSNANAACPTTVEDKGRNHTFEAQGADGVAASSFHNISGYAGYATFSLSTLLLAGRTYCWKADMSTADWNELRMTHYKKRTCFGLQWIPVVGSKGIWELFFGGEYMKAGPFTLFHAFIQMSGEVV